MLAELDWTESDEALADELRDLGCTAGQIALEMTLRKGRVVPIAYVERPREPELEPDIGPTCQYPHGDPQEPGFHFCGVPAVDQKPYCEEHCAICYEKPGEKDDD